MAMQPVRETCAWLMETQPAARDLLSHRVDAGQQRETPGSGICSLDSGRAWLMARAKSGVLSHFYPTSQKKWGRHQPACRASSQPAIPLTPLTPPLFEFTRRKMFAHTRNSLNWLYRLIDGAQVVKARAQPVRTIPLLEKVG